MPAGKQILDRIKSVKNTGKITRAMELISTVKMKKAADIAIGARPFAIEASGIFSRVADEISMSPYVQSKNDERTVNEKTLIVVITSNRGLC
jgi:F-type H+-transporting ATPase subunit gamma